MVQQDVGVRKVVLQYWHSLVSNDEQFLEVEFLMPELRIEGLEYSKKNQEVLRGFYACYDEGVFFLFAKDTEIYIGWDHRIVAMSDVASVSWRSAFFGRFFCVKNSLGKALVVKKYRTMFFRLMNPYAFFMDFFDDDWGLVADLPSFVHSSFGGGSLFEDLQCLLNRLNC